ncbi:hypothetical protein FGO68_gene12835 [Halteria grandinella]|uniref:Uncharacterized protein n=1 Tax=Halteria grandinella TaxID=5974 RepID=A0A8J8P436_HALGN|nr:hypothetical protein FGO68_gene12835 [Halteria grandinella]
MREKGLCDQQVIFNMLYLYKERSLFITFNIIDYSCIFNNLRISIWNHQTIPTAGAGSDSPARLWISQTWWEGVPTNNTPYHSRGQTHRATITMGVHPDSSSM